MAERLQHLQEDNRDATRELQPEWTLDGGLAGLTQKELARSKQHLCRLRDAVEQECASSDELQTLNARMRKREKATTRHLDRLLLALRKRSQFRDIEGVAFLWSSMFPLYASNRRHWTVLYEHFGVALNMQQRYADVIDTLFSSWIQLDAVEDRRRVSEQIILSPFIVEALLIACNHLKDGDTAQHVLRTARQHRIRLHKVAYFHLILTLVQDDAMAHFDLILQLCDEWRTRLREPIALSLQPAVIHAGAEHGQLERVMGFYDHPIDAVVNQSAEFRFALCVLKLWNLRHIDEMLRVMSGILASRGARPMWKEEMCQNLHLLTVKERSIGDPAEAMRAMWGLMDLMLTHDVSLSESARSMFLRMLIEDGLVHSVADAILVMSKYATVLDGIASAIGECIVQAVRLNLVDWAQEFTKYALHHSISIEYRALEALIDCYDRTGIPANFERASDIVHAMRMNPHMTLGQHVVEIGMRCNQRLDRFEEVCLLFESLPKIDQEQATAAMLEDAVTAYSKLNRPNEERAVRQLLRDQRALHSHKRGSLLDHVASKSEMQVAIDSDAAR